MSTPVQHQFVEFAWEEPDCAWMRLVDGSRDFRQPEVSEALNATLAEMEKRGIHKLVLDLSSLPYFGSTMLEFMIYLWKRVRANQGQMVIYGPTVVGREILQAVKFDRLWPLTDSREEALATLRGAE